VDVAIAGGHGKIALELARLLSERGHGEVRSLIRNPDHSADVRAVGAEPIECDLEADFDVAPLIAGVDAVVFAAGAGPGSGPERKWSVDRDGAIKLIEACHAAGVHRYVIVSSIGADDPPDGDDDFSVYLRAKHEADEALKASGLDYTIVRPVHLTDEPATGKVLAAEHEIEHTQIPRDDVAEVLATVLDAPNTIGITFEVASGPLPIEEMVLALQPTTH
jgi:uncharacterized protein YbjT (DUF2867 family)